MNQEFSRRVRTVSSQPVASTSAQPIDSPSPKKPPPGLISNSNSKTSIRVEEGWVSAGVLASPTKKRAYGDR